MGLFGIGRSAFRLLDGKSIFSYSRAAYCKHIEALRPKKAKSNRKESSYFADAKWVRTIGGKGGDGCISFLQLWANERAGPDGGDGGSGGHIIFQASEDVRNLNHVSFTLQADDGDKGATKDCHGKNAKHNIIKVPVGTVIRNQARQIVGDLDRPNLMFVAARGGAGGKGNHYFTTASERSPKVCEYGPEGEDIRYLLELRSIADIGLIGYPNAGKSTLLNAISRAKPKIAPYAFTTLRPHIGIVHYDDHTQLRVADLPGLIPGSHENKGLGIQFLKHAERCTVLMVLLDVSYENAWEHYEQLMFELRQFSSQLVERPKIVVANKIDMEAAQHNYKDLQTRLDAPVIPISAKMGTNLEQLLKIMRNYYDTHGQQSENPEQVDT